MVNQAVGGGFFGGHEVVAVGVAFDFFQRLAGVFGEQFVQRRLHFQQFARVDFDVGCLAAEAAADQGLVDHDAAVGQGEAFAFRAGREQERAHAGGLAEAEGGDVGLDEVHGVEHRHAGGYRAAGGS